MKLEELARLAGVSKATASIVVNGSADRYRISPATQEKVLTLARKYHFIAEGQMTGLQSSGSKLVALIVPDLSHCEFTQYGSELERLSRKEGFQLLTCSSYEQPDTESDLVKTLVSHQVDAFVVISCLEDYGPYYAIEAEGKPVVLVDRSAPDTYLNCIKSDDRKATKELVMFMLETAQEDIVYLGGTESMNNSQQRLQGYRDALAEAGLTYKQEKVFHKDFRSTTGYRLVDDYFKQHGALPQNLFTASVSLMEGVLRFFKAHPGSLPENPNWATLGNHYLLDWLPFPVTSSLQDDKLMARQTIIMLEHKLNGLPCEQRSTVPRKLIRRDK